jgi:hypothetical protein
VIWAFSATSAAIWAFESAFAIFFVLVVLLLLFISPKMSPDLLRVKIQQALQASEKIEKNEVFLLLIVHQT